MRDLRRLAGLGGFVAAAFALSVSAPRPLWLLLAAATIAIACLVADQLIHARWRAYRGRRRYHPTLWILPALVVAGGFLVLRLPFFSSVLSYAAGTATATLLFVAVVVCQLHSLASDDRHYRIARFALNLLIYLIAFGVYAAIYAPRARSLYSATAVAFVTALMCLELFRGDRSDVRRAPLYAGLLAFVQSQITWGLNYWLVSPLAGGLLLLVSLYVGAGVVQSHLSGELDRRSVIEFAGVAAAAVALVVGIGFLPP